MGTCSQHWDEGTQSGTLDLAPPGAIQSGQHKSCGLSSWPGGWSQLREGGGGEDRAWLTCSDSSGGPRLRQVSVCARVCVHGRLWGPHTGWDWGDSDGN